MHRAIAWLGGVCVIAAACRGRDPAPPPQPPPSPQQPPSQPPPPRAMHVKTEAGNDFPHLRELLGPRLAPMRTCLPPADLVHAGDVSDADAFRDPITIALDAYDDHLVACARMITARGGSVFDDPVSYACWNVDPATGALARRADLARAYFECGDGQCAPYADRDVPSYDGASRVALAGSGDELAITTRAGAAVRTLPSPIALGELLRGQLTYVGHAIFLIDDGRLTVIDDEHGATIATLPATALHVVDAGHVVVFDADDKATLYDLATRAATPLALPAVYAGFAVRFHDQLYAIDDARRLAVLDPTTFAVRTKTPLAVCP